MNRPTLDAWIESKLKTEFTRASLKAYQLKMLNETLRLARGSKHYARVLPEGGLSSLSELENLPFTTPKELCAAPRDFVCVSPREIERIVSALTSGSSGRTKRVFFTAEDLELCADFFHHGMRLLCDKSDRVGILFPAAAPGSVGELLARGLNRDKVENENLFALAGDFDRLGKAIENLGVTVLAGFPGLIADLARVRPGLGIRAVLLSADYVSESARAAIKNAWGAEIFEHYGMTEMGLGCAVSCYCGRGGHIRENDLLIEIIDPVSGQVLPEGERGEIVFTTLTRRAMPLIRYRTGDMSRIVPGKCPCGTRLLTLGRVEDRGVRKKINLQKGGREP